MKLLFDENLSPSLASRLADLLPGSMHVRDAMLKSAPDSEVWTFASSRGFTIISKDADFRQRSLVFGHPPKVIGVLLGNCSTSMIESLIRQSVGLIVRFEKDPTASFLELP